MADSHIVTIRPAVASDAESIYALKVEAFGDSFLPFTVYSDPRSVVYLRELIDEGPAFMQVAVSAEGKLIGYTQAVSEQGSWFLGYIAVAHECRNQGIGRMLLDAFESEGATRGHGIFGLDVFEKNAVAVEWYAKLGYRPARRTSHVMIELAAVFGPTRRVWCEEHEWRRAGVQVVRQGFSKVPYYGDGCTMTVGLIGDTACKLLEYQGMSELEAISSIRQILGSTRKYLILSSVVKLPSVAGIIRAEPAIRLVKCAGNST
ncbi:MAG: GNAT family N-acetyltransferase [Armatimonadetes bacterium]|nr:GNAT family N-acetyltransferase [Armatimonadota bacterium]